MLVNFDMHMSTAELVKRTAKETLQDDAMGLAAQLAYYFFLSLFPALLCLVALASLFPLQNFTESLTSSLSQFAPAEVVEIIRTQMLKLAEGNDTGLLSV